MIRTVCCCKLGNVVYAADYAGKTEEWQKADPFSILGIFQRWIENSKIRTPK